MANSSTFLITVPYFRIGETLPGSAQSIYRSRLEHIEVWGLGFRVWRLCRSCGLIEVAVSASVSYKCSLSVVGLRCSLVEYSLAFLKFFTTFELEHIVVLGFRNLKCVVV